MSELLFHKWLKLDAKKYDKESSDTENGVEFQLHMSPYDLPDAVRGGYSTDLKRFVIQFKYISAEPTNEQVVDEHVTFRVGAHSRRLYSIEVDVDSMKADQVALRIVSAVDQLAHSRRSRDIPEDNYGVVKDVIREKSSQLFALSGS